MDPQSVVDIATSANATALGTSVASTEFQAARSHALKCYFSMSPADKKELGRVVSQTFVFATKTQNTSDHPILAATREFARQCYTRLSEVYVSKERKLVVGSAARELRMYDRVSNLNFHFHGREGKDVSRTVIAVYRSILETTMKNASRKDRRTHLAARGSGKRTQPGNGYVGKISKLRDLLELYDRTHELPPRCSTEYSAANVLLFEDSIYEFDERALARVFKETNASVAYGYACLPDELIYPEVPAESYYTYRDYRKHNVVPDGFAEMYFSGGMSNGYVHKWRTWSLLLRKMGIKLGAESLNFEIVASFGPMRVFRIDRARTSVRSVRLVSLPERRHFVKILDILQSVDKRTLRVFPMERRTYLSISKKAFYNTYHYACSLADRSRNFQSVITYIRRMRGGVSLMNAELLEKWSLDEREVDALALLVVVYTNHESESHTKVVEKLNVGSVKKRAHDAFINAARFLANFGMKRGLATIWDWIHAGSLEDELVLFPDTEQRQVFVNTLRADRVAARTGRRLPDVPIDLEMNVREEDDSGVPDCPFCANYPAVWFGDQKVSCFHKDPRYVVSMSADEVQALKAEYRNHETDDNIRLRQLKEAAAKVLPVGGFSHETRFHYLEAGPGCGKTYTIKKMFRKSDALILAPFRALEAEYDEKDFNFSTLHHAIINRRGHATIVVDEFTSFEWRALKVCIALCGAKDVYFVGDIHQTQTIEGKEGESICVHVDMDKLSKHVFHVNFRNPLPIVAMLNKNFGYKMEAYNRSGEMPEILTQEEAGEKGALELASHSLAFTKAVASARSADTVRSQQGQTVDNVILYVSADQKHVQSMTSMQIVGLSRHRGKIQIVHDDTEAAHGWLSRVGAIDPELAADPEKYVPEVEPHSSTTLGDMARHLAYEELISGIEGVELGSHEVEPETPKKEFVWVYHVESQQEFMSAVVSAHSLKSVGTKHEIMILTTHKLLPWMMKACRKVSIELQKVDREYHIESGLDFSWLQVFSLPYERVALISAQTIFRRSPDKLVSGGTAMACFSNSQSSVYREDGLDDPYLNITRVDHGRCKPLSTGDVISDVQIMNARSRGAFGPSDDFLIFETSEVDSDRLATYRGELAPSICFREPSARADIVMNVVRTSYTHVGECEIMHAWWNVPEAYNSNPVILCLGTFDKPVWSQTAGYPDVELWRQLAKDVGERCCPQEFASLGFLPSKTLSRCVVCGSTGHKALKDGKLRCLKSPISDHTLPKMYRAKAPVVLDNMMYREYDTVFSQIEFLWTHAHGTNLFPERFSAETIANALTPRRRVADIVRVLASRGLECGESGEYALRIPKQFVDLSDLQVYVGVVPSHVKLHVDPRRRKYLETNGLRPNTSHLDLFVGCSNDCDGVHAYFKIGKKARLFQLGGRVYVRLDDHISVKFKEPSRGENIEYYHAFHSREPVRATAPSFDSAELEESEIVHAAARMVDTDASPPVFRGSSSDLSPWAVPNRQEWSISSDVKISALAADISKPISFLVNDGYYVVNAANEKLERGGGVCGALFKAAGEELVASCRGDFPDLKTSEDGVYPTGTVALTPSFRMSAFGVQGIFHAVGPDARKLRGYPMSPLVRTYRNLLRDFVDRTAGSALVLPLISSGIFGYTVRDSLLAFSMAFRDWFRTSNHRPVHFVLVHTSSEVFENFDDTVEDILLTVDERSKSAAVSPASRESDSTLGDLSPRTDTEASEGVYSAPVEEANQTGFSGPSEDEKKVANNHAPFRWDKKLEAWTERYDTETRNCISTLVMGGSRYTPGAMALANSVRSVLNDPEGVVLACMVTSDVPIPSVKELKKVFDEVWLIPTLVREYGGFTTDNAERLYGSWARKAITKLCALSLPYPTVMFVDADMTAVSDPGVLFHNVQPTGLFSDPWMPDREAPNGALWIIKPSSDAFLKALSYRSNGRRSKYGPDELALQTLAEPEFWSHLPPGTVVVPWKDFADPRVTSGFGAAVFVHHFGPVKPWEMNSKVYPDVKAWSRHLPNWREPDIVELTIEDDLYERKSIAFDDPEVCDEWITMQREVGSTFFKTGPVATLVDKAGRRLTIDNNSCNRVSELLVPDDLVEILSEVHGRPLTPSELRHRRPLKISRSGPGINLSVFLKAPLSEAISLVRERDSEVVVLVAPDGVKSFDGHDFKPEFVEHLNTLVPVVHNDFYLQEIDHGSTCPNPLPKPCFDSHKFSYELLPEISKTQELPLNHLASHVIPPEFTNGVLNVDAFSAITRGGNPAPLSTPYWSLGGGFGTTHTKGNPSQTLNTMSKRYLSTQAKPRVSEEERQYARKLALEYIEENENQVPFNIHDLEVEVVAYIKKAIEKNYNQRFQDSNVWSYLISTFSLKDQYKTAKYPGLKTDKAAQGISAWSTEATTLFQLVFRWLGRIVKSRERPHVVNEMYSDPVEFREAWALAQSQLPSTTVPRQTDWNTFDAQQCAFSLEIEKQYLLGIGCPRSFVDFYAAHRATFTIQARGLAQAQVTGPKASGEPGTLFGNTALAKVVSNHLLRGEGPSMLSAKGDDFYKSQLNLELDEKRYAALRAIWPVDIQQIPSLDGSTFCGYIIYQNGLYPDLMKKHDTVLGKRYLGYEHFTKVQQSLRDFIEDVEQLDLLGVFAANVSAHKSNINVVEGWFQALQAFSHIDRHQWDECAEMCVQPMMKPIMTNEGLKLTELADGSPVAERLLNDEMNQRHPTKYCEVCREDDVEFVFAKCGGARCSRHAHSQCPLGLQFEGKYVCHEAKTFAVNYLTKLTDWDLRTCWDIATAILHCESKRYLGKFSELEPEPVVRGVKSAERNMLEGVNPTTLLDVGAGDQSMTKKFVTHFSLEDENVLCVEPNAEMARLYSTVESIDAVKARKFDLVILRHVLHHVDDWKALIKRARRLVAPGGVLFVVEHEISNDEYVRKYQLQQLRFRHLIDSIVYDGLSPEMAIAESETYISNEELCRVFPDKPKFSSTYGSIKARAYVWKSRRELTTAAARGNSSSKSRKTNAPHTGRTKQNAVPGSRQTPFARVRALGPRFPLTGRSDSTKGKASNRSSKLSGGSRNTRRS